MARYSKPSIIEALCEFAFVPDARWDLTVFGHFDAEVRSVLPEREQVDVMVRRIGAGDETLTREPRVRFFGPAREKLAQVGPNLLSVNVLPPYPHWAEFRLFIQDMLRAYKVAANPSGLARMTLRYLDRIAPPASSVNLGAWLNDRSSYVPRTLLDSDLGGMSRVQKRVSDGFEVVTTVHQTDAGGTASILLDTELAVVNPPADEVQVLSRLDQLHHRVIEIFEDCISDKTRELLGPEDV